MATKSDTTDADVIARLAGKGEQAMQKLADLPGGNRALKAFNDLRERVDELSKRVRGIDALEQRVARLEKEVAALRRAQKPPAPQRTAAPRKAVP
jgi:phage shock protein A